MPRRDLDEAKWVALFLLLTLLLGVFGLVRLLSYLTRRRSRFGLKAGLPGRMSEPVSFKVTAIFWTIFLGGLGLTIFFARGLGPSPVAPEPTNFVSWLNRLAIWSVIATTVLPVLARWRRRRDETVLAMKRAEMGDVDGAIRDLRQAILARGPAAGRSHALAQLMMRKGNWIDARKLLLEAEDLSEDRHRYRGDMAVVLKNLGRPGDALSCIEPLIKSPSASLEDVCVSCDLLIDLDRLDAARDRIAQGEGMFKRLTSTSPSLARRQRPLLDACRERLEMKFASWKSAGLEEL